MKTIALNEARAQYGVDPGRLEEPTIIEVAGQPVAVLMPYEHYLQLRNQQRKGLETSQLPVPRAFLREEAAFYRLLPELLEQHRGRYVGIYKGKVVAIGDSVSEVLEDVESRLGRVHPYVGWVNETPRIVRMPIIRRVIK